MPYDMTTENPNHKTEFDALVAQFTRKELASLLDMAPSNTTRYANKPNPKPLDIYALKWLLQQKNKDLLKLLEKD